MKFHIDRRISPHRTAQALLTPRASTWRDQHSNALGRKTLDVVLKPIASTRTRNDGNSMRLCCVDPVHVLCHGWRGPSIAGVFRQNRRYVSLTSSEILVLSTFSGN